MTTSHMDAVVPPWVVDVSSGMYQTFLMQQQQQQHLQQQQQQQQDTELRTRLECMEEEIEELRGRVDRRNKEIQDLLDEKRSLRERMHTYREQTTVLTAERDAARLQLQAEIKGRENLQQKCQQNLIDTKKLELSFKSRESEVAALKKSLEEEKQLCSKMQLSIDACVTDAVTKQTIILTEQAKQKHSQLDKQVQQLRTALATAASSNHAAIQDRERQLESLRHQVFHITQERDTAHRNLHTHLLPKLGETERVIGSLKAQVQHLDDVNREAENSKAQMVTELTDSRRDVLYWQSEAEALVTTKSDVNRWKAEVNDLKAELSRVKEAQREAEELWERQAPIESVNNNMNVQSRGGGGGGRKRQRKQSHRPAAHTPTRNSLSPLVASHNIGRVSAAPLLATPTVPLLMNRTPLLATPASLLTVSRTSL